MKNYLELNRKAYNTLAQVYRARIPTYLEIDKDILSPFIEYLNSTFKSSKRVIELGPGSGLTLSILSHEGFFTLGVDIAENMLEVARSISPEAVLIHGDFLHVNLYQRSFEGAIARSSLHLFTKKDALLALDKFYQLLVPKGILHIGTTVSNISQEGYFNKEDCGIPVLRFRKYWTEQELESAVEKTGFHIYKKYYHFEKNKNKHWINLLAIKGNESANNC